MRDEEGEDEEDLPLGREREIWEGERDPMPSSPPPPGPQPRPADPASYFAALRQRLRFYCAVLFWLLAGVSSLLLMAKLRGAAFAWPLFLLPLFLGDAVFLAKDGLLMFHAVKIPGGLRPDGSFGHVRRRNAVMRCCSSFLRDAAAVAVKLLLCLKLSGTLALLPARHILAPWFVTMAASLVLVALISNPRGEGMQPELSLFLWSAAEIVCFILMRDTLMPLLICLKLERILAGATWSMIFLPVWIFAGLGAIMSFVIMPWCATVFVVRQPEEAKRNATVLAFLVCYGCAMTLILAVVFAESLVRVLDGNPGRYALCLGSFAAACFHGCLVSGLAHVAMHRLHRQIRALIAARMMQEGGEGGGGGGVDAVDFGKLVFESTPVSLVKSGGKSFWTAAAGDVMSGTAISIRARSSTKDGQLSDADAAEQKAPLLSADTEHERLKGPGASMDCQACFDREADTVLLECGHRFFCYECAKNWLSTKKTCPVCNQVPVKLIRTDSNVAPSSGEDGNEVLTGTVMNLQ